VIRAALFSLVKLPQKDAEAIFDAGEPVGRATDVVMPRRRWFSRWRKPQTAKRSERIPRELPSR
jgi:hypothetical protein